MKKKIERLARLQEAENRIDSLERVLAEAPQRSEALAAERSRMQSAQETAEAELALLHKRYRELDRDARHQQDQAKKREARLHEVKTNKEYQAALKEIDDLRAAASQVEDEMIGLLDEIESAEAALNEQRQRRTEREAVLDQETAALEAAMAEDRRHLEAACDARDAIAAEVEPGLLATFRHACDQQKNRVGVAAVCDAVCQGCHMNIPPQLYNELQRQDSLKICPLCQRIIYWEGA